MTLSWLVEFVGLALLYALVITLVGLSLAQRTGWVNSWRLAPLLLVTLFFVFLTQHPFPVPHELKCPMPSADPQLRPFNFWDTVVTLYQRKTGAINWLANKTIVATAINFLICAVIGATMARHTHRILSAAMFGITLTIAVEITQLTGFWGIYPGQSIE